jgi:AbrB family looped-hinge helix DNA binding protein
MQELMSKLGAGGRVIIPAEFRAELHLNPGDPLVLKLTETGIEISSFQDAFKKAKKLVQKQTKGKSLVKMVREMRRQEFNRE